MSCFRIRFSVHMCFYKPFLSAYALRGTRSQCKAGNSRRLTTLEHGSSGAPVPHTAHICMSTRVRAPKTPSHRAMSTVERARCYPLYQQRCLDVPQSDEHRPGAVCLQMAEPAGIHHVERAGARVHQPEKVVEGVGVTGVTARTPSRSGICSLPTSLSTLKRVPNECCALNLNAGLQVICACRRIRVAAAPAPRLA